MQVGPLRSLHVLGTNTDVGKSWVTALILRWCEERGLKGLPIKPVHSGWPTSARLGPDLELHPQARNSSAELCAYPLEAPMSPFGAAQLEGKVIEKQVLDRYWSSWQGLGADVLVVEGIGGVCCPLGKNFTYLDWLAQTKSPSLLVSSVGLGSLNHSLLSLKALAHEDCTVEAIVPNEEAVFEEGDPIVSTFGSELSQLTTCKITPRLRRGQEEQNRSVINQMMDDFWARGDEVSR